MIGEPGFCNELESAGLKVVNEDDFDDAQKTISEEEFESYKLDSSVVAVTVGYNYTMNYRKLSIASLYINENKTLFIGANPDRNTGNESRYIPAGGTIIKAIESATGV